MILPEINVLLKLYIIFTARRGFAVVRYLSVCPSVRHVGILYPNGWSYRQTAFSAR